MTSGDSRISGAGKRRLKVGCVYTVVILAVGTYLGIFIARRAITGPQWMRNATGIVLPPPVVTPPAPQAVVPPPGPQSGNTTPPVAVDAAHQSAPLPDNGSDTSGPGAGGDASAPITGHGASGSGSSGGHNGSAPPAVMPNGGWLVGTWETSDVVHPPGAKDNKMVFDYVFESGGSGEFDTDGHKLYDLHWEDVDEYVQITFVTDTEGDDNWKVKMKYSLTPDHALLTMVPMGKKDPRGLMYNLGPGIYHRK